MGEVSASEVCAYRLKQWLENLPAAHGNRTEREGDSDTPIGDLDNYYPDSNGGLGRVGDLLFFLKLVGGIRRSRRDVSSASRPPDWPTDLRQRDFFWTAR